MAIEKPTENHALPTISRNPSFHGNRPPEEAMAMDDLRVVAPVSPVLSESHANDVLMEDLASGTSGFSASISYGTRRDSTFLEAGKGKEAIPMLIHNVDVGDGCSNGKLTPQKPNDVFWNDDGDLILIDLDNEYFLVRFANEDDFHHVLAGGPWVIYESYPTVQHWSRDFSTALDHHSRIMIWVRLPGLPYRYYTGSLLCLIAGTIGEVVRIDYNTPDGKRGRFTRLAVVINLDKPLVYGILIDDHRQTVEYEGMPTICFGCGKYGHVKELCKEEVETSVEKAPVEARQDALGKRQLQGFEILSEVDEVRDLHTGSPKVDKNVTPDFRRSTVTPQEQLSVEPVIKVNSVTKR
ncbi:hypothetical protein F3Y22_tig00008262pilonHSYRG00025 [Hibiscus syriacus]|uniref:CCHC-type domain-containing protein n=1 Tax=Hibiscus syriacus TaxID=106335 RepID=A0A6A3CAB9_HIBSY|nr:hypothetical protein F3Y22_tig00008262pilonHSYRG00025 [Hibiscus syriacus]